MIIQKAKADKFNVIILFDFTFTWWHSDKKLLVQVKPDFQKYTNAWTKPVKIATSCISSIFNSSHPDLYTGNNRENHKIHTLTHAHTHAHTQKQQQKKNNACTKICTKSQSCKDVQRACQLCCCKRSTRKNWLLWLTLAMVEESNVLKSINWTPSHAFTLRQVVLST